MSPVGAVRVGIIGCGGVVRDFHLPALERASGVTLSALADTDPERLSAAADPDATVDRYASHERLLEESGAEAILVALPPRLHGRVARDVLASGRPLLLEKPIALEVAEAERLVSAAEAIGVVACTAFNLRCHPFLPAARRVLETGELGRIRAVRSRFTTAAGAGGGWRSRPDEGGDVLLDLGIHHFDLAAHLLGGPLRGIEARRVGASSADPIDACDVEGRLPGGATFRGRYGRGDADVNRLEVAGTRATMELSFYDLDGLRIEPGSEADAPPSARVRQLLGRLVRAARHAPSLARGGPFREAFVRQWEEFAARVRGERRSGGGLADLAEGAAALEAASAARKAAGRRAA